jgi:hypothetical protein
MSFGLKPDLRANSHPAVNGGEMKKFEEIFWSEARLRVNFNPAVNGGEMKVKKYWVKAQRFWN